jgi:hypothetical protein
MSRVSDEIMPQGATLHYLRPPAHGSRPPMSGSSDTRAEEDPILARRVRAYIKGRRLRIFPAALFADPAWDILLDLFVEELERKVVSVTSACVAAQVPPSTALRWVAQLEQAELVLRDPDPHDRRRYYLRLSTAAHDMMRQWAAGALPPDQGYPR